MALHGISSAGVMSVRTSRLSDGVERRHVVTVPSASLMVESVRRVCSLRNQAGEQYSAVEWTRTNVAVRKGVVQEMISYWTLRRW